MKPNKKKDYGLYCFRLTENERSQLTDLLNKAKDRLNRNRGEDEYIVTKNRIIFEAIKLGLPLVKVERK